MSIQNLSAEQLRRAAQIKEQITELYEELSQIGESSGPSTDGRKRRGRRRMSAAGRAAIAAAQRARWAKQKSKPGAAPKRRRRRMSAAARAKIAAAAKARWAKAKAAGKSRL